LKSLLHLQELDLKIEKCKAREAEIPKQKSKFDVHKKRLAVELEEREDVCKNLQLEQRTCESEIEQKQAQVDKYDHQLLAVKKNEEYQALLHEIDLQKKQMATNEERIIALMLETDEAKERLTEDKKRIEEERATIDAQCAEIDQELAEAVEARKELEARRLPLIEQVDPSLLSRYKRIRSHKGVGAAVVPLRDEICSGCNMYITAQVVNEILGGEVRACAHCGRLLYDRARFAQDADTPA
jgi:uncharacterized protein